MGIPPPNTQPNIVYVMADQLRYQSCGYTGDERARTPNIDRLAGEGVSFPNAVVSMPVCSAYRASLMTGKYTTSTGMVINEIRLNPEHHPKCLAHCLDDAGYELGYIGKWHLWANQLGNHHAPENSFTPPGPYRLGFNGYWAAYNFHHEYYGELAYCHTDGPTRATFPEGVYEPDGQTDLAITYIREHANAVRPFALFLAGSSDHMSVLDSCRVRLKAKMIELNDTFDASSHYRKDWVSGDRVIMRTATCRGGGRHADRSTSDC